MHNGKCLLRKYELPHMIRGTARRLYPPSRTVENIGLEIHPRGYSTPIVRGTEAFYDKGTVPFFGKMFMTDMGSSTE